MNPSAEVIQKKAGPTGHGEILGAPFARFFAEALLLKKRQANRLTGIWNLTGKVILSQS